MIEIDVLKRWFEENKRDFPWRLSPTPYAVWVSEMMLQQTLSSVVVPYFNRWMERFPDLKALAEATLDEVIKQWEGLGYYSRARYLHQGAQYIIHQLNGQFPKSIDDLKKIKGIGPYTIGAIRSFAFHERAAAVDGNVMRVLARYFMLEEDLSNPATVKNIWSLAESILPEKEPWIISEALIELGATVCSRKPNCRQCPLQNSCLSYRHGKANQLPIKTKKIKTEYLYRAVAIIFCQDKLLLRRGKPGKIMSDLHEFPYFDIDIEGISPIEFQRKLKSEWSLETNVVKSLQEVSHSFTRFQAKLYPIMFTTSSAHPIGDYKWVSLKDVQSMAFSSGHRQIIQELNL